jgi:GNAT superfamily N-acetyltransferase
MNISLRHATINDADAVSLVHIQTWKSTYRGVVPDHVLDNLDHRRNILRWRDMLSNIGEMKCFIVAETEDGRIIGFATGGPNRELDTGYNGELYAIYILEEYQSRGIGRSLVLRVADWLRHRKYSSMIVWVLEKNPAKLFYESLGGRFVCKKKMEIGGALLDEISYGWPSIENLLNRYSKELL